MNATFDSTRSDSRVHRARMVLFERDRHYHFEVFSASSEKLVTSSPFRSVISCVQSMMQLQQDPPGEGKWETHTNLLGQHFFLLRDANGRRYVRSGNYWSASSCAFALKTLLFELRHAEIVES